MLGGGGGGVHLWSTGTRDIKRLHLTPLSNNFSVATTARQGGEETLSLPDSLSFIPSHSLLPPAPPGFSFCALFCCQQFKWSWITSPSLFFFSRLAHYIALITFSLTAVFPQMTETFCKPVMTHITCIPIDLGEVKTDDKGKTTAIREVLGNHLQTEPFHKFPHLVVDDGGGERWWSKISHRSLTGLRSDDCEGQSIWFASYSHSSKQSVRPRALISQSYLIYSYYDIC